jgi:hypothetical protein
VSAEWLIIRGSGIAAFAMLSAAVIWGLLVSSKLVSRLVKAKPLTWFHESLGIAALIATLIHAVVLSVHDFLPFTWSEILIPGLSDWKPMPVALGVVAMYGLAMITVSFYVRKWIGQRMWRSVHYGSFGVFMAALFHGIQAGTDSAEPLLLGLYIGSTVVVFALLAHRLSPGPGGAALQSETNGESTAVTSRSNAGM